MSDAFFRFVPRDPRFVADAGALDHALTLLRAAFPAADEVKSDVSAHVLFRDCGENFDAVECSGCGADVTDAWGNLMDMDFDGEGFRLEPVKMPCCGASVPLHDLRYLPRQAFGRLAMMVLNGGVVEPEPELVETVENALGCSVHIVLGRC